MTVKKAIVTGASGWLGNEICRQLLLRGANVVGVSRTSSSTPVTWHAADLRDAAATSRAIESADVLIHAAGLAHQFHDVEEMQFRMVNVDGTANAMRAAAAAGIPRAILISSMAVYGSARVMTEATVASPVSAYGASKLQAEIIASQIAAESGLRLSILRLATLYGPGDRGNVARLISLLERRRFLWVGDGSNRKSLIHVRDAARAAIMASAIEDSAPAVYNVVDDAYSMKTIVDVLSLALARKPWPLRLHRTFGQAIAWALTIGGSRGRAYAETLRKFMSDDVLDGSLFKKRTGFVPEVRLSEGLHEEVRWYRASHASG